MFVAVALPSPSNDGLCGSALICSAVCSTPLSVLLLSPTTMSTPVVVAVAIETNAALRPKTAARQHGRQLELPAVNDCPTIGEIVLVAVLIALLLIVVPITSSSPLCC